MAEPNEKVRQTAADWLATNNVNRINAFAQSQGFTDDKARAELAKIASGEAHVELASMIAQIEECERNIRVLRASLHASSFGRTFWSMALETKAVALVTFGGPSTSDTARHIRDADCYAWAAFASTACSVASQSIPPDSYLLREHCPPQREGWWWFETPLKAPSKPDFKIDVLSWEWVTNDDDHSADLMCRAWSTMELPNGRTLMSTCATWYWREGSHPHDAADNRRAQRVMVMDFIANTSVAFHDLPQRPETDEEREEVAEMCGYLSRFFLAGCAWLTQRVVTEESGHIERHRRKQLAREHGLLSTVKVIHLRRSERRERIGEPEESTRQYLCRWVVDGHWRNQACGPQFSQRKLIYVLPYVKGPDDQPLMAHKRERIFAVNR